VGPEDVIVTETPRTGWAVAAEAGETVALDLELTDDLRRAGVVREAVRLVQEARKRAGLAVSDRIELWWDSTDPLTAGAMRTGGGTLGEEVLAVSVTEGPPVAPIEAHADSDLALRFWLRAVG
jgi:isoleucyl-tRNA synthetase